MQTFSFVKIKILIKSNIIPSSCISKPLKGKIAKVNAVLNPGIKKLKIVKEQTGQPAENKLKTEVKIPVPDSLLYFLTSLNLKIINTKFIPNSKANVKVNKMFNQG